MQSFQLQSFEVICNSTIQVIVKLKGREVAEETIKILKKCCSITVFFVCLFILVKYEKLWKTNKYYNITGRLIVSRMHFLLASFLLSMLHQVM